MVRFPAGLRDRIAARAKEEGRSMNAEIVAALEAAYPPPIPLEDIFEVMQKSFASSERPGDIRIYRDNLTWLLETLSVRISDKHESGESAEAEEDLRIRVTSALDEWLRKRGQVRSI